MLNKYFGFTKVQDEFSVIDSLLEHTRIDEEEVHLLVDMIQAITRSQDLPIQETYDKIRKIRHDSNRIFENISEEIIQADFDHQKQNDLLRLYQQIKTISSSIIASAKRIVILHNIGGDIPLEIQAPCKEMAVKIRELHKDFHGALEQYYENKSGILSIIHGIIEKESQVDDLRLTCIESLYKLGNSQKLPIGTFRAVENVIDRLEDLADNIEDAAISLECLLIY